MGIPIIELCRLLTVFKYIINNVLAQLLLLNSLQLNEQYQVLKTSNDLYAFCQCVQGG